MEIFEIGQVVRLKSGGPKMTIKKGGDAQWDCQWFDRNGKIHDGSFAENMLDIFIVKRRDEPFAGE